MTIHVFGDKESFADISTELPCLGDLENPGRLPVQHVLGGTGDCVMSSFEICSLFMFLRSGNPFADIPTELPCLGDLENSGHLPV